MSSLKLAGGALITVVLVAGLAGAASLRPARGSELLQAPDTVFLEELTWTEVRALIDGGTTTVIVPTAGTEQNGPHIVLGKHRYRMQAGAERIARELGNALVAPVIGGHAGGGGHTECRVDRGSGSRSVRLRVVRDRRFQGLAAGAGRDAGDDHMAHEAAMRQLRQLLASGR